MRFVSPLLLTMFTACPAWAQDGARDVMVVFDMSGSMWGQVDGVAKVEIARDAFGGLLGDWAANDTRTGLIAYGHRRRGDCSDIELLASPGDQTDIASIIAGLRPVGKTPLSDAVKQAAEVLKYTEEAATVVLLSDGVETCEADPCAVGAELEALGLDFTAHVIGFDIAEGDKAQLQCLASATGGQYFDAADASGLTDAMGAVADATAAVAPPAEPAIDVKPVTLRIEMPDWTRVPPETVLYIGDTEIGRLSEDDAVVPGLLIDLPYGLVTIRAEGRNITGSFNLEITDETEIVYLPLTADADRFVMQPTGPLPIAGKHLVLVKNETGVNQDIGALVYLMPAGSTNPEDRIGKDRGSWETEVFWTIEIDSPPAPGAYDVVIYDGREIAELGRVPLTFVDDVTPEWLGLREVAPGGVLDAIWQGDANKRNGFQFTREGGPRTYPVSVSTIGTVDGYKLQAPEEPGLYDLSFTYTDADGARATAPMGQIAVGVEARKDSVIDPIAPGPAPVPDPAPEAAPQEDTTALETEDEAALAPTLDLDGTWRLIRIPDDGSMIRVLDMQTSQTAGTNDAAGQTVVLVGKDWGFGAISSFGGVTLSGSDADTVTLTLTQESGTLQSDMTPHPLGWSGPIAMGDGVTRDVILTRPHDMSKAQADLYPDGLNMQVIAVDERGTRIEQVVTWTVQGLDVDAPEVIIQEIGKRGIWREGMTPGSYVTTATFDGMSGDATFTYGRQERGANFIVLRPDGEGADLPIETAFYCSPDEDCRMTELHESYDFNLPEGWGATRGQWLRDSAPMIRMATQTADGPIMAALNQPYGFEDAGGTCTTLISGVFCHDATDDPQILADIATLRQSFSFLNTGNILLSKDYDSLFENLTGAAP